MMPSTCRSVNAWIWKVRKRLVLCSVLVFVVHFGYHYIYHLHAPLRNISYGAESERDSIVLTKRPKIVFWATYIRRTNWNFVELSNGDGGCDVSFRRKNVAKADAVIFIMKSSNPNDRPPLQSRRPNQVYVWSSQESPWTTLFYYRHRLSEYDNYFNWTMTYRTDSDILAPLWPTPSMDFFMHRIGRNEEMLDKDLVEKPRLGLNEYKKQMEVLLRKKTNLIAWIVSNCRFTEGAIDRMEAVEALENTGINVTKYGKCFKKPLPSNYTVLFQTLSSHKFYVAFENTLHCKDYLTEKTPYNSFVSGAVPIIRGPTKKDTERILPAGSYIHVEDFENVQRLSEYLHYLDKNDSAYMEYFKWWMYPGAQTFPRFGFNYGSSYLDRNLSFPQYNYDDLQHDWREHERFGLYHLCRRLKRGDHLTQTRVVPNLVEWWFGDQPTECIPTLDVTF